MKLFILLAGWLVSQIAAIELDVYDDESIRQAASTVAHGMMEWYKGNETGQTPGILPYPHYWWEAGAMFGALVDYWYLTGDDVYNQNVIDAIVHQSSPTRDFMPPNQTKNEGNDDQAFWGMAAMGAAEVAFPNPPEDQPQYLALAQGVFNSQVPRWAEETCGGGLRWQIFTWNNGYHYKNTISNGGLFNIAARLGAYTKNETYFEWANRVWDWSDAIGLINHNYQVFDGSDSTLNCTEMDHTEWSYNNGILLHGAAVMWNQTEGEEQERWGERLQGLFDRQSIFFTGPDNDIMFEVACERNVPERYCNQDQVTFKGYLARWMAASTKLAPWTYNHTMPLLRSSAMAAAQACTGGSDGVTCGNRWWDGGFDGREGVGIQMAALEVIQNNLIERVSGVVSEDSGGTSQGDVTAGTEGDASLERNRPPSDVTTKDKAGAGILTAIFCISTVVGAWWLMHT